MGFKGLKPKAKFLMLLYSEDDLQGLGFPVGAPKASFPKTKVIMMVGMMVMMMMMMMDWGLKGLKPKAKCLMPLYSEHGLQGLGFPIGAPKASLSKSMMMMMMMVL